MSRREFVPTPGPSRNETKRRFNEASSKQKPAVNNNKYLINRVIPCVRTMDDGQMIPTSYTGLPSLGELQTPSARTSPMMTRTNNEWSVSSLRGQNLLYTSSSANRPHIGGSLPAVPRESNKTNQSLDASKKDYATCVICINEESRLALVPCGHVCLCETCSPQFKLRFDRCPICQQIYTDTLKIYLGGSCVQ